MEGGKTPDIIGSSKVTWNIRNFSQLSVKKLYSDTFVAGGCKWCLRLCPKEIDQSDNVDYLSIYLDVADSRSLPQGWSREVMITLALVSQFDKSATVAEEFRGVFNAKAKGWGFPHFMPLSEVNDPAKRYLVNDSLTVEAVVVVLDVVHYSVVENQQDEPKSEPDKAQEPSVKAPLDKTPRAKDTASDAMNTDQEKSKPVTAKNRSKDEAPVRKTSKRLLEELSSRRKKQKPIFSDEISGSSQTPEPTTDFQQQQKEALRGFFKMSLEAIQQANCFVKIEEILHALVHHTNDLQEKTTFEDIMSQLATFRRSINNAKEIAEAVEVRRSSLAGKAAGLDSKLEKRQKELSSLEFELSTLSDKEEKLRAEIDQVIALKNSGSAKLEKANEETCKEIEEWRNLEAEMKQVNAERAVAKEKLVSANLHWDLFREDLGL